MRFYLSLQLPLTNLFNGFEQTKITMLTMMQSHEAETNNTVVLIAPKSYNIVYYEQLKIKSH